MKRSIFSLALVATLVYPMTVSAQQVEDNAQETTQQDGRSQRRNPIFKGIELTQEQKDQLKALENPFMMRDHQRMDRDRKDGRKGEGDQANAQGRRGHGKKHRHGGDRHGAQPCQHGQCQGGEQSLQAQDNTESPAQCQQPRHQGFKREHSEERQQMMQQMVTARTEYLEKVSKILTPEQYNQLLENMVIYQPMMAPRQGDFKGRPHQRMHHGNAPAQEGVTESVVVGMGKAKGKGHSKKERKGEGSSKSRLDPKMAEKG